MLERILLAGVITFCIYLFLNLGGESASIPSIKTNTDVIPGFISWINL